MGAVVALKLAIFSCEFVELDKQSKKHGSSGYREVVIF